MQPEVMKQAEILDGVGHGEGSGAQRLRALHSQALGGDDSAHRPQGTAAGALAVRPGPRRRVRLRRHARAGLPTGLLGAVTTNSGPISRATFCPTPKASEAALEFDSANGDLVANYRLGPGVEEPARRSGNFRVRPGRLPQADGGQKGRGGNLPRKPAHRQSRGPVPRAPGGGIARVSRRSACTAPKPSWTITARTKRC